MRLIIQKITQLIWTFFWEDATKGKFISYEKGAMKIHNHLPEITYSPPPLLLSLNLFNIWLLRMYGVTIFFSFIETEITWHFCYVKWHLPVCRIFFSEITHNHSKKSNGRPLNSCLLSYQFGIFKPSIKWNAQYLTELTKASSRLSDSKDDAHNSYDTKIVMTLTFAFSALSMGVRTSFLF